MTRNFSIACIVWISCNACIPGTAFAQVTDDFSDGDFIKNPAWSGDTAKFEVNTYGQLHLRTEGSDTSILATPFSCVPDAEWRFWVKMSFNTSANNYTRVCLSADTADLSLMQTGYYLQAGGIGDSLSVVRTEQGTPRVLYRFVHYRTNHSTNLFRVRITRDHSGWWSAQIDTTGGEGYFPDGTFFDDSFLPARWLGVVCRYTQSNASKFYFDDFYAGPLVVDSIPPFVNSAEAITPLTVRITYSEPVNRTQAEDPVNYRLAGQGEVPDSVRADPLQENSFILYPGGPLPEEMPENLSIREICDLAGNRMADTMVTVLYHRPKAYDLLIDEILADPDPPVALPPGEFAELFNRSDFPVNLAGWSITSGGYTKTFTSLTLQPKEYAVVAKDSAYMSYGKAALLFTSSYSIPNDGAALILRDDSGRVIHSVNYDPDWFRGMFKEEGGWSLEMIDPGNPCGCGDNWVPSEDPSGGTPGRKNSAGGNHPDEALPYVISAWISGPAEVGVTFSEAMDSASMLDLSAWRVHLDDSLYLPVGVKPDAPDFTRATLFFPGVFQAARKYGLRLSASIHDCAGNAVDTSVEARFAIPEQVSARDLVINEILADPESGGARFLEIFNRSEKVVDLRTVVFSGEESAGGFPVDPVQLTPEGRLLFPGEYAVITPDPTDICRRYYRSVARSMLEMDEFPVLGSDSGTVFLARYDNLEVIDRVKYRESMHYPLLITTEGVSLERTDPEMSSENPGNWHSAAETAGFGTPGCLNSHSAAIPAGDGGLELDPEVFSPDNDGRDDLLRIVLRTQEPGQTLTLVIYDSRGRRVRQLADNVLTADTDVFTWDGMDGNGDRASRGFFIVVAELHKPGGKTTRWKRTAVLALP